MQENYIHSRTSVHLLQAHVIFVTKYRRRLLTGNILSKAQSLMSEQAAKLGCEISEFNGERDHIHMLIQYPPKLALAKLVQSLKSISGYHLPRYFPEIQQPTWKKQRLWSPSYFTVSVGGAPIEVLRQYIEQQARPH